MTTNLKFLAFGDLHADVYTDAEARLEKIIEDTHFPNSERKPCIYPVVPDAELIWLENELQEDKKFIVFSHISLVHGFEARGIRNREEILKLFKNREVLLCMNGHNHGDDIKIINDTLFYTVNASTGFSWWGETDAGFTVIELPYADPLHVVVELNNGNVRISGMQSYYTEKKPEEVGVVDNVWKGISTLPRTSSYNVQ